MFCAILLKNNPENRIIKVDSKWESQGMEFANCEVKMVVNESFSTECNEMLVMKNKTVLKMIIIAIIKIKDNGWLVLKIRSNILN